MLSVSADQCHSFYAYFMVALYPPEFRVGLRPLTRNCCWLKVWTCRTEVSGQLQVVALGVLHGEGAG